MPPTKHLSALETLASRGRPTISCTCELDDGTIAAASIPAGASSGRAEARELRDGDPNRYGGLGCQKAVANIEGSIAKALINQPIDDQRDLDQRLIPHKDHLGANAILAVSIAFARAAAGKQPLYHHFASMIGGRANKLPRLTINLFSGGKHAGGQVAIQDVLIVPASSTIAEGLAVCHSIYQAAARYTQEKYHSRALVADEGGLAPAFPNSTAMIEDAVESIRRAGLRPGIDAFLAVDVAASHFEAGGR